MARDRMVETIAGKELAMEQRRGFGAVDAPAGVWRQGGVGGCVLTMQDARRRSKGH